MSDLDLTDFLKEGSVPVVDHDWLAVDERRYRQEDRLPKQNIDITPDLAALWDHEDKPPTSYFVPNDSGPRAICDMSTTGPVRVSPEDILREASLRLTESTDLHRFKAILTAKFPKEALAKVASELRALVAERGLLGSYYVRADSYPTCHTGSDKSAQHVRNFAASSLFVLAKDRCSKCTHAQDGRCGVFQKWLVPEIPYTEDAAKKVEASQISLGRKVASNPGADPKTRIKEAYLALPLSRHQGEFTGLKNQGLVPLNRLTQKKTSVEDQTKALSDMKAKQVVALIRKEMLKGRSLEEVGRLMKLSFDAETLSATRDVWAPVVREAGLYGVIYTTQDSFANCHEGAGYLSKLGSKVKFVVAGSKCSGCLYNKVSQCMLYGKKIIASPDDAYTQVTVDSVIWDHKLAGTLPQHADKMSWGKTPRDSLKAIHKEASSPTPHSSTVRVVKEKAFRGGGKVFQANASTTLALVKTARKYLNEGLYGEDLLQVLGSSFETREISAASEKLKEAMVDQGLQGIEYIDPTVYDDYGHGCKEAARLFRTKGVPSVKLGSACATCIHHSMPDYCSRMDKVLIEGIPEPERSNMQQAILASGPSTETDLGTLVNDGTSDLLEFQLQHREAQIDLNPEPDNTPFNLEFGGLNEFPL